MFGIGGDQTGNLRKGHAIFIAEQVDREVFHVEEATIFDLGAGGAPEYPGQCHAGKEQGNRFRYGATDQANRFF